MAIGTPVALSSTSANFGITSGTPFPTTAAAAAGSLIVVCVAYWNVEANTVTSVTDSVGNTYVPISRSTATSGIYGVEIWACVNAPIALPSGGAITVVVGGAHTYGAIAYSVSGAGGGPDAIASHVATTGATSESLTTAALVNPNEIIFAITRPHSPFSTFSTWAPGTGFTNIGSLGPLGAMVDYAIVSGLGAKTYAPSWTPSSTFATALATFQATLVLDAEPGSFSLAGKHVSYALPAHTGHFALSGGVATLTAAHRLQAAEGGFVLAGQPAMFTSGQAFLADLGSFALTGETADLMTVRKIQGGPGSFSLTGKAASMTHGPKQWSVVPINPDPWTPVE